MRLESARIMTMAAVAGVCLPTPAAAQRQVVEGMSQRLTVACGADGVKVQGASNTVTLTGTCGVVLVEGSNNTVHIGTLGRLTVAGMNNKVFWSNGIDGAAPKITKEGIGNTVEKKTPADSDAPAKPSTTTPSTGGGTAGATAASPSGGATATAAPGNPTLTVGSGNKRVGMGASAGGAGMSAKRGDPAPARPASSSASSTGSGLPILVPTNQNVKTMECEGRAVSVQGNGNRLTLKGRCGPVTVGGNENILDVGSTTRIDTSGNRNVVKYRELVDDKAPVVTAGGSGNRVSKAEPQ
jgi:hypothetical protein